MLRIIESNNPHYCCGQRFISTAFYICRDSRRSMCEMDKQLLMSSSIFICVWYEEWKSNDLRFVSVWSFWATIYTFLLARMYMRTRKYKYFVATVVSIMHQIHIMRVVYVSVTHMTHHSDIWTRQKKKKPGWNNKQICVLFCLCKIKYSSLRIFRQSQIQAKPHKGASVHQQQSENQTRFSFLFEHACTLYTFLIVI